MNKKRFLGVMVIGVFMLAFVNAGLITYYGQASADIEVTQPITITGDLAYTVEAMAGDTVEGEGYVTIYNYADFPVTVEISNNAPEGVNVIYEYAEIFVGEVYYYQILEGNTITIPPNIAVFDGYVKLRASYELDAMLETETYIVTTTID